MRSGRLRIPKTSTRSSRRSSSWRRPSRPPSSRHIAAGESRWTKVADDPEPFLDLGLSSRAWLSASIDALIEAESEADFQGEHLVHNDVYSANVAFTRGGAMLVDGGAALRGSRWIDTAFALLSLRVERGTAPSVDFPLEAAFVSALSGHLAVEAAAPLPDWAEPGSTLREDMRGDLRHALQWATDLLALPPLP